MSSFVICQKNRTLKKLQLTIEKHPYFRDVDQDRAEESVASRQMPFVLRKIENDDYALSYWDKNSRICGSLSFRISEKGYVFRDGKNFSSLDKILLRFVDEKRLNIAIENLKYVHSNQALNEALREAVLKRWNLRRNIDDVEGIEKIKKLVKLGARIDEFSPKDNYIGNINRNLKDFCDKGKDEEVKNMITKEVGVMVLNGKLEKAVKGNKLDDIRLLIKQGAVIDHDIGGGRTLPQLLLLSYF